MEIWGEGFNKKRNVNGKDIIIGQQNFIAETILIKYDNKIIECPMYSDKNGDIYFIYNDTGVYISDFMGEFSIK